MNNPKRQCPPCIGNCREGRDCPNFRDPDEDDMAAMTAGLVLTLFCMAVMVICLALLSF
jgi:hypothetical protein